MPIFILAVLALGLSSVPQLGDAVTIDHAPAACATAGQHPRVDARFTPAERVAIARVFFQGRNAQEWYSVDMKAGEGRYSGVLPSPLATLDSFRYYLEVTDPSAATSRTPEYKVDVMEGAGACRGRTSFALGTASVLIHGPVGATGLPVGFAPAGVTMAGSVGSSSAVAGTAGAGSTSGASAATGAAATGGGLSTAAIVGIAGGVGGVAAIGAAASGKDDTTPSPSNTLATGQWVGTFRDNDATPNCGTLAFSTTLNLNQSGSALTGSMTNLLTTPPPAGVAGCAAQGTSFSGPVVSGSASGSSVQFVANFTTVTPTRVFTFTGSISGSTLSGTYVTTLPDFPQISVRGTLSATKQ